MKENLIDTPYCSSWLENGIVHNVYKPGLIITIDIAKQMVGQRLEVSKNISRPVFIDIRNLIAIDAASRSYLAGDEGVKYASAGAIYLNNYIQFLLGNVFLKIDNPLIPTRLFTEKEKALLWLQQHKH